MTHNTQLEPQRVCFVNCGRPADQCYCLGGDPYTTLRGVLQEQTELAREAYKPFTRGLNPRVKAIKERRAKEEVDKNATRYYEPKYVFGKSATAIYLEKNLKEGTQEFRRVSSHLSRFSKKLKSLAEISDYRYSQDLMRALAKEEVDLRVSGRIKNSIKDLKNIRAKKAIQAKRVEYYANLG